jgi:glycosyltransferase involved in cell wall biosynthesis
MHFLSAISSLNPADGGPVECVLQLQRNLTKLGHVFDLVTSDKPNAPWIRKVAFEPFCLGTSVHGKNLNPALIGFFRRNLQKYDAAILHGIWTFQNIAFLRAWDKECRFGIFPHGMLDPYFIKNFPVKHIKKSIYYRSVCVPLFKKAHAVLFTCEEEKRLAAASYGPPVGRRIVVRYGIDDPGFVERHAEGSSGLGAETGLAGKDVLLFLGRFHPKKGGDMLIGALARVAARAPNLHLAMVGPGEAGIINSLKALATRMGVGDRISWRGPIYGDGKWLEYKRANAFILPSHMENFGMSVAEALSQGCPVLISDKVNIFASITRSRAGYVEPDTLEGTTALLERWAATPTSQRSAMSASARRLFVDEFQAIHTSEDLVRVFRAGDASPRDPRIVSRTASLAPARETSAGNGISG